MNGKNKGGKGGPKSPKIIPVWWIYIVIGGLLLSFQFLDLYNGCFKPFLLIFILLAIPI